jgi:signal transduction protein with GAF and PtsI domain
MVIEANRRARQDSLPFELEYHILTKTGHQKTIRELGYAVKNEDGQVIRLFGTAQDVSSVKKRGTLENTITPHGSAACHRNGHHQQLEVQLTLDIVIKTAVTQLGVDAAAILLYQPDSHQLEFTGWQGFRTPKLERIQLKLGKGLAGKAILNRKKIFVADLANEADEYVHKTLYVDEGFVSYFGTPLLSRGEIKGVLEILHRSPLQPDEDWLAFLDMLSEQAAIAIDNAQLFEGVNRSNLKLAMAYGRHHRGLVARDGLAR